MSSHNTESVESGLASLKLGRDSLGRIRKRESTEFHTYTFPDFHKDTRVVAVCGVTTIEDAHPKEDGWFLADFYLFNVLLRGLGSKQTWLTTLQPERLVSTYTEYLHGNPYQDRRVVLSQDILDQKKLTPVRRLMPATAPRDYLEILRQEAAEVHRKHEPLLLLLFGHGHESTSQILIGSLTEAESLDTTGFPLAKSVSISQVQSIIPEGLQLTILSNSCYSGAWAAAINSTALTAADDVSVSLSWNRSSTLRYSGSMWMTMLVEALKNEMREPAEQEALSQSQEDYVILNKTFNKFAAECHSVLTSRVDRLFDSHKMTFSAQQDDWNMSWSGRTGIPLARFEDRFNALPIRPTSMEPKSYTNRDPALSLSDDESSPLEHLGMSLMGRYGSVKTARRNVLNLAVEYLNSHPGMEEAAGNQRISADIAMLKSKADSSMEHIAATQAQLEYRLGCTKAATTYLSTCGIPLPLGLACHEWDRDKHINNIPVGPPREVYKEILKMIAKGAIMPEPFGRTHGARFPKPSSYIAFALLEQYRLDPQDGKKKAQVSVDKLVAAKERVIGDLVDFVLRSTALKPSKREWASSLRKRLRSLSPRKANRMSGYSSGLVSPSKKHRASLDNPPELSPRLPRSPRRRGDSSASMSDVAKGKRKA